MSLSLYQLSVNFEKAEAHGNTEAISEQPLSETQVINNPTYENIRVLIKTDNYEDVYHSDIVLEGDNGMRIVADNSYIDCGAGEEYAVNTSLSVDKMITVEGIDVGKLHIKNLKRNSEAIYSGKLELIFTSKGIVVINDVPIEEYLYGVIPSEMPSTYPLEALKAQAVSARTYTYYHMGNYAYPEWKAHVDDSTTYQVYMNNSQDDKATQAVYETAGKVLTHNNEIVESFYYSTSGGYNGALAVWSNTSGQSSYLIETGNEIFATNTIEGEGAYKEYIDEGNPDDVEYDEAWYRWTYDKDISDTDLYNLLKIIYTQSQTQPENVEITSNDKSVENIIYETKISDIQILNRQKSGLVTKLMLVTPNYQIILSTQYTIRQILGNLGGKVVRKDQTQYSLNNMLPSAYFYIEYTSTENTSHLTIHGAGFGHGCGMSQNGAKNLAEDGYSYEEILKYYYNADIT
jgi:stage II sporulation protein D